jgi:nicotinamide-nucleotide amidase
MAEGALNRCKADIALSVTGFAGPARPGQEEGLVHFGLARAAADHHREEHFGAIGRGPVRIESAEGHARDA